MFKKRIPTELIKQRDLRFAYVEARRAGFTAEECVVIVGQAEADYLWVKGGESLPEKDLT